MITYKSNGNIFPPIVEHIQKKLSTMTLPICNTLVACIINNQLKYGSLQNYMLKVKAATLLLKNEFHIQLGKALPIGRELIYAAEEPFILHYFDWSLTREEDIQTLKLPILWQSSFYFFPISTTCLQFKISQTIRV
jgi:hypothetical protein